MTMLRLRRLIYLTAANLQGVAFTDALEACKERQSWSTEALNAWQNTQITEVLSHAQQHVPAYSNTTFSSSDPLDAFKTVPILTKEHLRCNSHLLKSNHKHKNVLRKTTGGSTGAPVTVLKCGDAVALELAAAWRGMAWAGISPGDLQARFWGFPHRRMARLNARLVDFAANRIRCSAFSFDGHDLDHFAKALLKRQPTYFYGYPSMLSELAKHIETNNHSTPQSLRAIITTAEPLTQEQRDLLKSTFRVEIYDEYGCGELGTIAHECPQGSLHLNSDTVYLEILDEENKPCATGDYGQAVITDLHNYAMPLIRYALADYTAIANEQCSCDITLPVLKPVVGRAYDMVENSAGQRFHGEFFLYIFEDLKRAGLSVDNFRVSQTSSTRITLELTNRDRESIASISSAFQKRLRESFDGNVLVDVEVVDTIPREPSGKRRVIRRLW